MPPIQQFPVSQSFNPHLNNNLQKKTNDTNREFITDQRNFQFSQPKNQLSNRSQSNFIPDQLNNNLNQIPLKNLPPSPYDPKYIYFLAKFFD